MLPFVQQVASDDHLPDAVDVVVVGGGIVGTAAT